MSQKGEFRKSTPDFHPGVHRGRNNPRTYILLPDVRRGFTITAAFISSNSTEHVLSWPFRSLIKFTPEDNISLEPKRFTAISRSAVGHVQ